MVVTFGADPIATEIKGILSALAAGESVDASVERQFVDLKEECFGGALWASGSGEEPIPGAWTPYSRPQA